MSNMIDKELSAKLAATTCKKCGYCHVYTKCGFRCPYFHGLNEDMSKCKYFVLSSYYKRKEKKESQSIALGKLIVENGITPKYHIGQIVYFNSFGFIKEKQKIRLIIASEDGKSYRYKVNGHRDYTYNENELFETEQELLIYQMKLFAKKANDEISRFKREANRLGMALNEPNILALAGSNEENK